jgi:hypothetical protein
VLLVLDESLLPSGGGGGPPALPEKVSPDEGADVELELDSPLLSDESMSSSADWSLELMVPAETFFVSSLLGRSSEEE